MHKYLVDQVGLSYGQKAHFKGDIYNVMATNIVKSLNSMLKQARQYPLLVFLNAIVEKMSEWLTRDIKRLRI